MSLDKETKDTIVNPISDPVIIRPKVDKVIGQITPLTNILADVAWFSPDLSFDEALPFVNISSVIRVDVSISVLAKLSVTFNGTDYVNLFEGSNVKANALYAFEFGAEKSDLFNIKCSKTVDVIRCVVSVL